MRCNRKSNHNVTFNSSWASVLPKFFEWFDFGETVILCQSCRAFHGDGVYVKLRAEVSKLNINSLVDMLIYKKYTEIIALGVTKSELLRTHASALDGIASCKPAVAMNDDLLVALTMLRLCAKFELTPSSAVIVLKHLSTLDEAKAAANMEWRLFRHIEYRSGLSLHPLVQ